MFNAIATRSVLALAPIRAAGHRRRAIAIRPAAGTQPESNDMSARVLGFAILDREIVF